MGITLILALSVTSIFAIYYLRKFVIFLYWFNKLPGPWISWRKQFLGVVFDIVGKTEAQRYALVREYAEKFPQSAKLWFGHMFMYFIQDPELIQRILSSNSVAVLDKPFFYKFFGFGDGLITASMKTWKPHRRILNGAFNMTALQSYLPTLNECGRNFAQSIAQHVDNGQFNILSYAVKCTLDNTCCKM